MGKHSSSARRKAGSLRCSRVKHRCLCWLYENKQCILGLYSPRPNVRVPLSVHEKFCPSCEAQKKTEREMFEADMEMDAEILRIQHEGYQSNPSARDMNP